MLNEVHLTCLVKSVRWTMAERPHYTENAIKSLFPALNDEEWAQIMKEIKGAIT